MPLCLISALFASYMSKRHKEFTVMMGIFPFKMLNNFFSYMILKNYDGNPENYSTYIFLVLTGDMIMLPMYFISAGSFFLRMCDT